MPRRNRVDPFGDLFADRGRGLFTGNRGCVVDDNEQVVRHHGSSLWITCKTEFRDWRWPLARPRRWTPLFFLDEAVALAAGHRPCAVCRRAEYRSYRDAVTRQLGVSRPLLAKDLNVRLAAERLSRGRGMIRAHDRILWRASITNLPTGTVIVEDEGTARLVYKDLLLQFNFAGWNTPRPRPAHGLASVLTPPTSVAALRQGYSATLHPSVLEY
ncbi:MAG: hypothetical protein ACI9BW_004161 [Gammaproteobacteria bacterium]|jgi:hypothetical protein